jgi:hypothetical protein
MTPRPLTAAVALVAAAVLITELVLTRVFSVLFFYHYSFFAVSLVMSGLSLGGLAASRMDVRGGDLERLNGRLSLLALLCGASVLAGLGWLVLNPALAPFWRPALAAGATLPALGTVLGMALAFLPGLTLAGAFLACAFAREPSWIARLYAADLLAAAAACLAAVLLMRSLPGAAALLPPVTLAALASLALWPRPWVLRLLAGVLALGSLGAAGLALEPGTAPAALPQRADREIVLERWNEYSRVVLVQRSKGGYYVVIDRSAGTSVPRVAPRAAGAPLPVQRWWDDSEIYVAHRLRPPLRQAAIIGFGGGRDLLAPLAAGASRVDGYEVNGLLVDLLQRELRDYAGVATWPEVSLINEEARVGLGRTTRRYDVIQASLIDTWASTASGGLVLSENVLYTVEGWRTFLRALSPRGILTFTRWYVPAAPAETRRLVSLAVSALADAGIERPRGHVALVASGARPHPRRVGVATILVSPVPFTEAEVQRLERLLADRRAHLLAAPGRPSLDPVIDRLLDPDTRAAAVADSAYDISPPTDHRPYFFLQLRLRDVPRLLLKRPGPLFEITFNALRVLLVLGGAALGLALLVLLFAWLSRPAARPEPGQRRSYRYLTVYFSGIGFGYMLIQLGLHQRVIVLLGHPTYALSVVLASMLLGTGLGAALSGRVRTPAGMRRVWLGLPALLGLVVAALPLLGRLEALSSLGLRAAAVGLLMGIVGAALGLAFPLGVRLAAGEWAVQKLWAVNGAASIAGSVAAALLGLGLGSRAVLLSGLVCYLLVALCGMRAAGLSTLKARSAPPAAP